MCTIDEEELREKIDRLTYAEVTRWKSAHDAELRRMKSGTTISIIVGLLTSFGAGHFWFEAIASRAVREASEPSFRIIAEYRSQFVADAEAARKAANDARVFAEKAAEATDTAVAEKLRQIASTDADAAVNSFLLGTITPLQGDVIKTKKALRDTLGELKDAFYEISQRSGGIATHPPYKASMEKHSADLKNIRASLREEGQDD